MTNQVQSGQKGRPLRQGGGFNLFYTSGDVVLTLGEPDAVRTAVGEPVIASLHVHFVGANPRPPVAGLEEVPGRFGNLVGSDPTVPHTGIARYRKVRYFDVYPGIDLTYSAGQRRVHSEFAIKPGADPGAIRLAFRGIDTLRLDKQGNLILSLADREVVQKVPVAYQVIDGNRQEIAVHLEIEEQGQVVFKVADHNRRQTFTMSMDVDYSKWSPGFVGCDLGAGDGYYIPVQGMPIPVGPTLDLPGPYGWIEYPTDFVYVSALEEGLDNCPILRDSIVWETGDDGQLITFNQWSADRKQVLYDHYDQLMAGGEKVPLFIACPDPKKNIHATSHDLYLSANEAFHIYAAHVAWALYVEAKKLVPWSLAAQSKDGRDEIFASYRYHSRIKPSQSIEFYPTHIKPDQDFQPLFQDQGYGVLRCDPRIGYWFVKGQSPEHPWQTENLLGASEEKTLAKLTRWFRVNVGHGDTISREEMLKRGVFLQDRLKAQWENSSNPNRWLIDSWAGCHTASALFYDLAKSVNIPLRHVSTMEDHHGGGANFHNVTHGGLVYRWDTPNARVLWHTDNIYADANNDPIFPIDGQGNPLSAEEADTKYFEAFWVSPGEIKSWGFEYKLELVNPQLVNQKFYASSQGAWEDSYDFGYMAGYWLRSDRAMNEYDDDKPVINPKWKNDLHSLYRLERLYQLCSWDLVLYYAFQGENGKGYLEIELNNYEQMKRELFRPWWLHAHDEYWVRSKACVNAYGGGPTVVGLEKSWSEKRGYPK